MVHRSSTPQAARDALKTLQHLRKTGQFQLATLDAMLAQADTFPEKPMFTNSHHQLIQSNRQGRYAGKGGGFPPLPIMA